ncbi:MAG: MATE family efflux transporter [Candidatus Goldiibacteriota bacterium]
MKDLTQGHVFKNLIIYSWPIMIADLLQSLYSAIDAVWVGRLIGPNALAAISASMPITFFLISLLIGLTAATVIMVGQAYGMKDMNFVSQVLVNSFCTILVLVGIMSLTGFIFAEFILKFLNTPPEIIGQAARFIKIIFAGLIFMFAHSWFAGILRGLGDSKTPLLFSAIYVALNISLCPVLILGLGPLPALGIAGSALSTVIAGAIVTLIAFIYLARKNVLFNILKWKYRLNFLIIKKMFLVGLPVSLQMVIVSLSAIVIISIVNRFGPDVIAAYGIGIRIDQFSFIAAMSFGAAASAFTAQAAGADKFHKVPDIAKWTIVLSLSVSALFFLIVLLTRSEIAGIFTSSPGVISHASLYFLFSVFSYFAYSVMFAYQGIIRGTGNTVIPLLFAFISLIIFRALLAWLLVEATSLRETAVWIALLSSSVAGMILNYLYYRSGRWRNNILLNPKNI